jgi:hypothetical protein
VRRITAVTVASAAVLLAACEGNGSGNTATTGPQCTVLQGSQNLNNWSNCQNFLGGGGGGGGNAAGLAPAALYRLIRVNGKPLPFNFDSGGVEDSVVTTDSTRVINFLLDSSYISLNTDSSAVEIDYLTIRDERIALTHPPANFNKFWRIIADTSTGTWSDSTGQPTILLLTGKVSNLGYQYHGDTLTANYAYNVIDSLGTNVFGTGYFVYQNIGKSFSNRVAQKNGGSWSAAAASPILHARSRGPSLSLVGSDYRRGRLVWVVGQQH